MKKEEKIIIKDYEDKYFQDSYKLLSKMWKFHELLLNLKEENHDLVYRCYLDLFLVESEYKKVVVNEKDELLGYMIAKNNNKKTFKENRNKKIIILKYGIKYLLGKFGDKKRVVEVLRLQDEIYAKVIPKKENYDSEIELFLMDEKSRGLGIGKKLMDDYLFGYCKQKNHKKIILFTDEECTYSFYEKYGFYRHQMSECKNILVKVLGNRAFSYRYDL